MRIASFVRVSVVAACVLVSTACDSITQPGGDFEGTYILSQVDGHSLPAIEYEDDYEQGEYVAGVITLLEDGDWTASTTYRVITKSNGRTRTEMSSAQGIYSLVGSRIRLESGVSAEIYNDRLELTQTVNYSERVLTYRKAR